MPLGGQSLAGVARVSFEAQTGEFNSDIARTEAIFRGATRDMSDESLRLELAQDKLRRSLAKGPAAFREQARAELQVRNAERALRGETDATTRSLDRQQRELGQASRGALLGTGAFRSLGRSVAFASAGFLGGAGLVYGMRAAINVASNLEEQQNKVNVTFRDSGQEVIEWSKTTSTSIGIARDKALEYTGTIGGILNVSGLARNESSKLARELVALAADMASFNNASPEETLEALRSGLVGEAEPLRRYSVLLSAARVETEAFASGIAKPGEKLTEQQKVLARYQLILKDTADQQGDFARTSDGLANSQRTLSALWRDAQGLVGQALAPAYTDAVQSLRDWLAVQENQEQLQRTVNALVGDGEKIVRGFAGGLRVAKNAAAPLVEAMGGIENAVRAATLLWVAFKVKAILGFAGTALASRATSTKMIADAVAAGAAWDYATRARFMPVTTTYGTGGPGGPGAPGGPTPTRPMTRGGGPRGGLPGRINEYGRNPQTPRAPRIPRIPGGTGGAGAAGIAAAILISILGPDWLTADPMATSIFSDQFQALIKAARRGQLTAASIDELERRKVITSSQAKILRRELRTPVRSGAELPGERAEGAAGVPQQPLTSDRNRPRTGRRRTLADIELDIARPGNEMGDLREKRSFIQRQIDAMEKRGVRTKEQKDKLAGLYGDLAGTESQIQSIIDEGEQKIADQREQAKADREEAREQAATRLRERIGAREETLANQQAAAELTKRVSDDRKAIRQRIALYRELGKNKQLEPSERRDYVGKAIAAQKELQDLNQKEIKAREDAEDKALDAFEKKTRARDLRSTKKFDALSGFGGGLAGARAGAAKRTKDAKDAEKGITAEQVRSMQFEFLTMLQGTMNQLGGNLFAPGQLQVAGGPNPELYSMVQELRQQTGVLTGLSSGVRQPGTKYAGTEIAYIFDGPTF